MSGLQEPRIFTTKPRWADLPEIKREGGLVTFKSRTGTIVALESDVEAYRANKK